MQRKPSIIRLGGSKSPNPKNRHQIPQTPANKKYHLVHKIASKDKNILHQSQILNKTIEIKRKESGNKEDGNYLQRASESGYQVSMRENSQKMANRQNIGVNSNRGMIRQSPFQRIIIFENKPSHQIKPQILPTQQQHQYLKKIKILQTQIQQLNKQKQDYLIKVNEQNSQLYSNYQLLEIKLMQCQKTKNKQLQLLREQIVEMKRRAELIVKQNRLRQMQLIKQLEAARNKQLVNYIYIDQQQYPNTPTPQPPNTPPSPSYQANPIQTTQHSKQHLLATISNLQLQNTNLRQQLQQIKNIVISTSTIIQSNNQQIISCYQSKISSLQNDIFVRKCQKIIQWQTSYQAKCAAIVLKQSQEINKKQQQCRKLQQKLHFSQEQVEWYVTHLLQIIQQLNNLGHTSSQLQALSIQIEQRQNKQKVQDQKCQLEITTTTSASYEELKPRKQYCGKCKQLITMLVKLNQKCGGKEN